MKIEMRGLASIDENDIVDGKFVVPDGLTSIGPNAFQGNQKLQEIIIPEGVKYIWGEAFKDCKNLTNITLPTNLTSIVLKGVNLKEIGEKAFFGCTHLTSITIPTTVKTIYADAFVGCTGMSKVNSTSALTVDFSNINATIWANAFDFGKADVEYNVLNAGTYASQLETIFGETGFKA